MALQFIQHRPPPIATAITGRTCRRAVAQLVVFLLLASAQNTFASDIDPGSASGKEQLTENVRLGDLIDHADAHNPLIQQAREAWRATVENYRVTTGYASSENHW